ncbi:hypothetical protein PLICRDRAFT_80996, partial [Plicaturopsis crispa FD-325 SS-3]
FVYEGEPDVQLYKKWIREVRMWLVFSGLKGRKRMLTLGKYLGGRAYQFYERDVLDRRKKYSLSEFFESLFDHVFPVDFRAQQREQFDACAQGSQTVRDHLQSLQVIANTVGDLDEKDIVLAFWRRCKQYLRIELTKAGYSPESISLSRLETLAVQFE